MKTIILAVVALASATAFARPNTTKMSCAEAQAIVQQAGEIVLKTGPYTYDLYLARGQKPAYVPTLDVENCLVGYVQAQDNDDTSPSFVQKHYGKNCAAKYEGKTQLLSAPSERNEYAFTETRTCINGKWVVYTNAPKPDYSKPGCTEGRRGTLSLGYQGANDHEVTVPAICRNGKYVPVN